MHVVVVVVVVVIVVVVVERCNMYSLVSVPLDTVFPVDVAGSDSCYNKRHQCTTGFSTARSGRTMSLATMVSLKSNEH